MRGHWGLALAVLLAATTASRQVGADGSLRHEGKTLAEWEAQAGGKSDQRVQDAARALGHARFLVDAQPVALRVLPDLCRDSLRGMVATTALSAIAEYGPLASDVEPDLSKLEDLTGSVALARIRILRDPGDLFGTMEKRWSDDEKHLDKPDLAWDLGFASDLGLRGERAVAYLKSRLESSSPKVAAQADAALHDSPDRWEQVASPLAARIARLLDDKEPVMRDRGAASLAWIPDLPKRIETDFFKVAKAAKSGYVHTIVKGIALIPHDPAATAEYLKSRDDTNDAVVSAWARAGLARRLVGAEREKLVVPLRKGLSAADPEVRTASADGLLVLRDLVASFLDDVQARLTDPDLRVRWRCAALLLHHDHGGDAAVSELLRGVDGPDDRERLWAFDAITALGEKAAATADRVAPWTAVPYTLIKEAAQRAHRAAAPH